ncbi:MAG: hypothetical protein JSW62_05820 [Thermoplasmatales archaeon]|nr:MAG: hypothetical protein JSW62_05820 [Thermoplasmatales archaeon]
MNKTKRMIMFGVVFLFVFSSVSAISPPDVINNEYIHYKTELSEFWGCPDIKLTNGTGFYDTHQDENDTWWIVTPDGYAFYSAGVCVVSPDNRETYNKNIIEKYGDHQNWANATIDRLKEWGFNTLGAWSKNTLFSEVPYTYTFISRKNVEWNIARNHPDVFDPLWQLHIKGQIENFTQNLKDDPYLIGYWLDNEMNWGPDSSDKKTLLEEYISSSNENIRPGKIKAVEFLQERYDGNVKKFNTIWKMNIKSFNELYDQENLGRKGWIAQHFNKNIKEDIKAFNQLVAETYFNVTTSLIREYDPNHMILGVRFHWEGAPEEIIEICGKYCNITSVNYYRKRVVTYDPIKYLQCYWYNTVPLDEWMKKYYLITGKPLLIGEISCAALDSGFPYPRLVSCKIVLTQKGRASYLDWYTKECLKTPYVVGYHWFAYVDKIENEIDNNFGLVNTFDDEYGIVDYLADINSKLYELHGS